MKVGFDNFSINLSYLGISSLVTKVASYYWSILDRDTTVRGFTVHHKLIPD